jgi:hypothetical protein
MFGWRSLLSVGLNWLTDGSYLRHPILCILAIPVKHTA